MSNADFVTSLLEKMGRNDKDFRYMACSDLLSNLEKENFKLDAGQEKKISAQLLKLIVTDTNGEVQTLAQNCLGPFIKKCSESQIKETITSLLNTLASENISYRDNSSFGLKTIVNNIPVKFGNIILALLVPKLIETLQSTDTPIDVKAEALDILPAALQRFGSSFEDPAVYSPLQAVVLEQLLSPRKNNRKRAGVCIAHLALYLLPKDFRALISFLVSNTKAAKNHDIIKSCIQTLGNLSKSAGFRLADCIDDVIPIVIACVKGEHQNIRSSALEADDELRENCFQTLESLVLRCPNTVGKHIENIIELCLEYVSYDPNFFAGSDDENNEDNMDTEDNEEFAAFEEEEEDYDNEDVSWKVRKAASKTISAIISTRQELLNTIATTVAPVLVNRFKEREETVKIDIFKTFENYLKQVHYASSLRETEPAENLRKLVGTIIAALTKILNEKTLKIKIRIGVFSLLKELVQVTNNALTGYLDPLIPGIVSSLSDKSGTSNLKIEVLTFLRLLYATHKPDTFLSHINQFIEQVFVCVGDNYYKINAEALRLCTTLVEVIATAPRGNFGDIISGLYNATLPKLRAQDIDQEVKETAINTASSLITHLGDSLSAKDLDECLKILESRLSNEITRLTCVKNLSFIANSPLHINLSSILQSSVSQITSFLRLNNRQLKQSALVTLDSFYRTQGDCIHALIPDLLEQTAPLIGDDDLQLSHLALQLTNTVLLKSGDALIVKNKIFPRILKLIESKVLQGLALESLLNLLETCITVNANDFGFQTIFSAIDAMTDKPTVLKQSYPSIAQVVASICAKTTESNRNSAVSKYIAELKVKENLKKSVLSLLCIGEIGRRVDLSNISGLESIIVDTFNDNTEDIKSAASFCLGNLAVGNLKYYLPFILKDIPLHNEHQYLLLQSLREVITKLSTSEKGISELQEFLNTVLVLLYENCKAEKEVVRNVVAECLGRLALVEPNILITGLKEKLQDPSPFDRWTAVTALKFAIVDNRDINDKLRPHIIDFLKLLSDEDLNVKKAALLTFNFIAHNKPILILDLLPTLLPALYSESEVKQELLRKVKVGPFHHLVDDGLENRKAAYECMSTLMEKCLNRLDLMVFIQYLSKGLEDHSPDIKSMCHIILERLASSPVAGASIVQSLESFVGPLHATLNAKPKETAVKQDKDRYEELVRSTLRAIYAIYKLPGVETCVKFSNFMSQVVLVGEIGEKFKSLQENSEADRVN